MSDNRQDCPISSSNAFENMSTDNLRDYIEYSFYECDVDIGELDVMMAAYNKSVGPPHIDSATMWEEFLRDYSGFEETFPFDAAEKTT